MPNVKTMNSTHKETHNSPYQNVRICQRKCDSIQVPRAAPCLM